MADLSQRTSLALIWAGTHGLQVLRKDNPGNMHVPITLFPTPFPRSEFQKALRIQTDFNFLIHKVAMDEEFLTQSLEGAIESDPFTKSCFDIYKQVLQKNGPPRLCFGIHRSDYMLHKDDETQQQSIKQVEINTISSSFGALSHYVHRLHRFLLERDPVPGMDPKDIPQFELLDNLAASFAEAVSLYAKHRNLPVASIKNLGILNVVQSGETNVFDQRHIELLVWERYKIPFYRRTLTEIASCCRVDANGSLLLDTNIEIAVVYFRAGYTPRDYNGPTEWDARLKLEMSEAVKCPNIAYHLAGSKKIQQVLAKPQVLERFVDDVSATRMRATFTGLYSMGSVTESRDDVSIARALENPSAYVLKPQREGGGNNIYDDQVREALKNMSEKELRGYILMDMINAPKHANTLLRNEQIATGDTLSELGVFGVFLSEGDQILSNKTVGNLLRTKIESSREGGVAAGFAVLDAPILY